MLQTFLNFVFLRGSQCIDNMTRHVVCIGAGFVGELRHGCLMR